MSASLNANTLLKEFKMSNTINDKFEFLIEKIEEYEKEENKKLENDIEKVRAQHESSLRLIRKNIEDLQGKSLTAYKKMEQMQMMLDVSDLKTDLKLKELEIEDLIERAEEEYLKKIERHKEDLESVKNDIIEDASDCSHFIERVIKGNKDDKIDDIPLADIIDSLDPDWKCLRERYNDIIGNERKNVKIFTLNLESLNVQRSNATNELKKCEIEKNFLQGKIGLDIIDSDSIQLVNGEIKKIETARKDLSKIERDIKRVNIQRDSCKDKIEIIKTMIDEIIGEMVDEYFKNIERELPEFLSGVKYFGKNSII
ncbi:MAG: hypothetical protein LBT51_06115 [Fusobacteriaceae bacterium]|jgi:hypothetical protein|nr:hypothetical protein [Fusobacteriaceae bacterium]